MKQLFFCLALIIFIKSHGQTIRALQVGDVLPKIAFKETLRNNAPARSINDLKGKLVILDFYDIGCHGCVYGLPHMDSLQEQFKDKIQVVIVCKNKRSDVEQLFKQVKRTYPQVPMMLRDTLLEKLFPHLTVPVHVWIDQKGIVRHITYDHNSTEKNINKFLNGEELHMASNIQVTDFNDRVNLFDEGRGRWNKQIKYHTLYAGYLEGLEHTFPILETDTAGKSQTFRAINFPIKTLFQYAYNESFMDGAFSFDNRIDVRAVNSFYFSTEVYIDSLMERWNNNGMASYEAVLPGNDKAELFDMMRRDLNRYSPFKAHVEKQKVKCLVLVNIGLQPSKTQAKDAVYEENADGSIHIVNYTVQNSIYEYLRDGNKEIKTPILDETSYSKKVDIDLKESPVGIDDPTKLANVRKELQANGLDLREEYRLLDILVIEDRD